MIEKGEFKPESCDDVDDVLSWLKCEKSVERANAIRVRENRERVRENREQSDWTSERNFIIFIIFFVALFPAMYLFIRVYIFCKNCRHQKKKKKYNAKHHLTEAGKTKIPKY